MSNDTAAERIRRALRAEFDNAQAGDEGDPPDPIAAERERCAQAVERLASMGAGDDPVRIGIWRLAIAEAARAVRGLRA